MIDSLFNGESQMNARQSRWLLVLSVFVFFMGPGSRPNQVEGVDCVTPCKKLNIWGQANSTTCWQWGRRISENWFPKDIDTCLPDSLNAGGGDAYHSCGPGGGTGLERKKFDDCDNSCTPPAGDTRWMEKSLGTAVSPPVHMDVKSASCTGDP